MLPIFRSNFSLTSILTLDPATEAKQENGPDSIFALAQEYSIKNVFLVENNLTGLVDAYENAKKTGVKLHFGYRLNICHNLEDKTPESENTTSKIIIFSSGGTLDNLIQIHNIASTLGSYSGSARIDFKTLRSNWSDNLILTIPFYDSYLHQNLLHGKQCVPDIEFADPFYLLEDNDLPFDNLISSKLKETVEHSKIIKAKTIYYNKRSDFKAYMAYRCILNRSNFQKPELQHFGSTEFCMEAWHEKNQ